MSGRQHGHVGAEACGSNDDRLKLRGHHPSEASFDAGEGDIATSTYSLPCFILEQRESLIVYIEI